MAMLFRTRSNYSCLTLPGENSSEVAGRPIRWARSLARNQTLPEDVVFGRPMIRETTSRGRPKTLESWDTVVLTVLER